MEAISTLDQPDQSIPQDSDVYVNYYGLTGDPFNPDKPLFFTTPHLEKLHRLFNYLSRFSRKLVVVTGESGAGKTALLEHFVQDQNEEDLVCYFAALNSDTPVQVLHEIADQLELDDIASDLPAKEVVQEIQAFSLARLDEGRSCIVVIDDAHLFDVSVLEQLYLLTLDDSQARCSIRLLLCGDEGLLQRLQDVVPAEAVEKTIFHQQISPLSLEETQQYLQVHFRENGGQNKTPFSAAEYQQIYDTSLGMPGRINEAAKQLMVEAVNRLVDEGPVSKKPRVFSYLLVPVLVIVSAIFWWQSSNSEDGGAQLADAGLTGQVERNAVEAADELELDEIFAEPEPEEADDSLSANVVGELVENKMEADEVAEIAVSSEVSPVGEESVTDPVEVIAVNTPELEEAEKPEEAEKVKQQQKIVSSPKTPVSAPEKAESEEVLGPQPSSNESLLRRHARQILAFEESAYTMQLLGSRNEDSILTTMNKVPGDVNLFYFEKTHKGAPWYVLIYGSYPSRAAADNAAANLPKALGNLKPWVRGVAGIQKEVILPAD